MRVIGVGYGRTGTTSLSKAMKILGFTNDYGWNWAKNCAYFLGQIEALLAFSKDYNNLQDWPWAFMYQEFDKLYEDAMFILTVRKDATTWYKSQCVIYDVGMVRGSDYSLYGLKFNEIIFGSQTPYGNEEKWICSYEKHNDAVRTYFKGRSNFIEVCWEKGDGWKELCSFLNKEVPEEDFPVLYSTSFLKEQNKHLLENKVESGLNQQNLIDSK